jgi:hypothetical protein
MKQLNHIFLSLVISTFLILSSSGQELNKGALINENTITILDRTGVSNEAQHPIAYGKRELFKSIETAGGLIESVQYYTQTKRSTHLIIGTLENTFIKRLVLDVTDIVQNKTEGVFYQWRKTENGTALIVGGTDSNGLMYALNELSQQINDKGLVALTEIKNTIEYPDNSVRGLDRFIKNQNDNSWFFSEAYWQYYIGQLAKNRFNKLTLITGYSNWKNEDFLKPVYPYLLTVPGFENVKLKDDFKKSPEQYLAQLRRIAQISHDYGLAFAFGIWGHGRSKELVLGLPEDAEKYTDYCSDAMRELLRRAPEIDGIQLRVNYESGVGGFGETAENFWKEIISAIGDSYKERKGNLFLDIRAKGLTEKMHDWILETGINLNVTSKYSWEGVGLPYHPTEMRKGELTMLDNIDKRQRYGYADFLYNSRDFDFIYRLWGVGTIRMFTWADPDYVKRFSHTANFGGSKGFQVTPPLSAKDNNWNLFSNNSLEYYTWEDQRYWAWYMLFGRLGYSKKTNPEVWERAFRQHYGKAYEAILEAYSAAGKVLPLITSSHLTYHPANYNWAEIESGGALFSEHNANPFYKQKERTYQSTEPGDPGLFYSIEDYVKDVLKDDVKSKINPIQLATYFENLSNETLGALLKVKKEAIPESYKKEFTTNEIDLKITAALASYHALKIKASTNLVFFQKTQNKAYLKSSINNLKAAKVYWNNIVDFTAELYHLKPSFLHDNGTWKDRLVEIEKDIDKLEELIGNSNHTKMVSHWDIFEKTSNSFTNAFEAKVPKKVSTQNDLKVSLTVDSSSEIKQEVKVHYRIANMVSGKFKDLSMEWNGENFTAYIPKNELNPEYDLLIYFTSITKEGHVTMHPGLYNESCLTPYYVVEIGE